VKTERKRNKSTSVLIGPTYAYTGETVTEAELEGHTGAVMSVAFSQDSSRVVSGSRDKTVRIWNAATGEMEAELKGHTGAVMSVAFSQDSSRVVSGSSDKTVRIWNEATGEMEAELKGHTGAVKLVIFSQDSSLVVSGSSDKTVRIWNVATGEMEAGLKGHPPRFHTLSPPQLLVSVSHDRDWLLGDARSDCWIPNHNRASNVFSFSGSKACFGYEDGRLIILDMTVMS
jgi:WD40 repeat protein